MKRRPKGWRHRALVLGSWLIEDLQACTIRHAHAMARHYHLIGVRVRVVNVHQGRTDTWH